MDTEHFLEVYMQTLLFDDEYTDVTFFHSAVF